MNRSFRIFCIYFFLSLALPLWSHPPCLDFYLQGGIKSQSVQWHLVNKKDHFKNGFAKAEWNNVLSPEIRGGVYWRPEASCLLAIPYYIQLEAACTPHAFHTPFKGQYREITPSSRFGHKEEGRSSFHSQSIALTAGYEYPLFPFCTVIPLIGCEATWEHYRNSSFDLKPLREHGRGTRLNISHLNYKPHWFNGKIGLKAVYQPFCGWYCCGGLEYIRGKLHGHANWSGQEEMRDKVILDFHHSLSQKGKINGIRAIADLEYRLYPCMKVGFHYIGLFLQRKDGDDHGRKTWGFTMPNGKTLDRAHFSSHDKFHWRWHSHSFLGSLSYEY